MNSLIDFLSMNGYGIYVWSAYSCVIFFLTGQWFHTWRKWKLFLKLQALKNESLS